MLRVQLGVGSVATARVPFSACSRGGRLCCHASLPVSTGRTLQLSSKGANRSELHAASTRPQLPRRVSRCRAMATKAMVNVDFASPSMLLGAVLIGGGVVLLQMRNVENRVSRDADIVVAAMISIVGSTLIFQGWRLDPLLLLCQALTTSVAVWYGLEAFNLRSKEKEADEGTPSMLPPPSADPGAMPGQYGSYQYPYQQQPFQQQQQQERQRRLAGTGYFQNMMRRRSQGASMPAAGPYAGAPYSGSWGDLGPDGRMPYALPPGTSQQAYPWTAAAVPPFEEAPPMDAAMPASAPAWFQQQQQQRQQPPAYGPAAAAAAAAAGGAAFFAGSRWGGSGGDGVGTASSNGVGGGVGGGVNGFGEGVSSYESELGGYEGDLAATAAPPGVAGFAGAPFEVQYDYYGRPLDPQVLYGGYGGGFYSSPAQPGWPTQPPSSLDPSDPAYFSEDMDPYAAPPPYGVAAPPSPTNEADGTPLGPYPPPSTAAAFSVYPSPSGTDGSLNANSPPYLPLASNPPTDAAYDGAATAYGDAGAEPYPSSAAYDSSYYTYPTSAPEPTSSSQYGSFYGAGFGSDEVNGASMGSSPNAAPYGSLTPEFGSYINRSSDPSSSGRAGQEGRGGAYDSAGVGEGYGGAVGSSGMGNAYGGNGYGEGGAYAEAGTQWQGSDGYGAPWQGSSSEGYSIPGGNEASNASEMTGSNLDWPPSNPGSASDSRTSTMAAAGDDAQGVQGVQTQQSEGEGSSRAGQGPGGGGAESFTFAPREEARSPSPAASDARAGSPPAVNEISSSGGGASAHAGSADGGSGRGWDGAEEQRGGSSDAR